MPISSRRSLPRRRAQQRPFRRSQVGSARKLDERRVAAQQRIHVSEVFSDSYLVALPFVLFVPLVVIVEDQGDDVEEVFDESIWRGRIDQAMEPAVEVGEV